MNGVVDGSDVGRKGKLDANPFTTIGGDIVNGIYFNGYVGEIIIFDRVLKAEERTSVTSYLAKKWSVVVN